jgi:glucose-6-phosphate isomerase
MFYACHGDQLNTPREYDNLALAKININQGRRLMTRAREMDVWQTLSAHQKALATSHTRIIDLFDREADRCNYLQLQMGPLLADFSKNLIDHKALQLLLQLAEQQNLRTAIQNLFDGVEVNNTEHRPALHVALRGHVAARFPESATMVAATLKKIAEFVHQVHDGNWRGYSGKTITDVVNIGIGGSDLGPAMAAAALRAFHRPSLRSHFVSNVDPAHMQTVLSQCPAESTLFVVSSKSFGTLETLANARLARQWYLDQGGEPNSVHRHFVAVSSNIPAAEAFGIDAANIFPLWDWVGGRYSLWSAIGLSIALATSMDTFEALLAGAAEMDQHFLEAAPEHNIPIIMGLLAIWYRNFWHCQTQAILPYAQDLALLPSFLQQLDMESLGKSVDRDGKALLTDSGAVIWGAAGSNGQHSFHQLLHQGTSIVPADFIAVAYTEKNPGLTAEQWELHKTQHQHLLANCFAQSRALMIGKSFADALDENNALGCDDAETLAHHRQVPGNRPSTTLLLDQLDARALGCLIALYEHKVYVQSVILGINAFDQWGVELGKQLSTPVFLALGGDKSQCKNLDASTARLLQHVAANQNRTC